MDHVWILGSMEYGNNRNNYVHVYAGKNNLKLK